MKFLFILLTIMVPFFVQADECGQETAEVTSTVANIQVVTETPKYLEGATITITKADGSSETVKASEYMVVKRKHARPVVTTLASVTKHTCTNIVPDDQKYSKNIISLGIVDGYSDVESSKIPGGAKLSVDRQIGAGLKYQRAYNNRFYFGVEADTTQGRGVFGGVGF